VKEWKFRVRPRAPTLGNDSPKSAEAKSHISITAQNRPVEFTPFGKVAHHE
jgi:hypothetical protein